MPKNENLKYLLTKNEAADFLNINPEILDKWVEAGAPKPVKRKYDLKSLVGWRLKFLASKRTEPKVTTIFGTNDAANFFEVDPDTLLNWAKKGAPKEARGKWDIKKLVEWRYKTENIKGKESPEVRKLKAEADLKEIKKEQEAIKLAVTEGRYVPVDTLTRDLSRLFTSIKNSLLAIGHKVAVEVNSVDEEAAVTANKVVDDCIREALEQLAKGGRYGRKK